MQVIQKTTTTKEALSDILLSVKWAHISTKYFGKSRSWFSQRLNGYDGNKEDNDFTTKEIETLRAALFDLSDRIRASAENL